MNKEISPQSESFRDEKDAWKKVLGVEVDIKPLPANITPEIQKNFEKMGMELRFIPALKLGTLEDLQKEGEESYLNNLQLCYPNWRRYESLSDIWPHSITRNLEKWYWGSIKDGRIDFPRLSGTWMAVEMMPKPITGDHYMYSKIGEKLGFKDRFYNTFNEANEAITRKKKNILDEAGLHSGDVRMLEAVEWNLLANREGWGKTDTYEWTNTEYHTSGEPRVIVGQSDSGGAARARRCYPDDSGDRLGFRVAVVFDPSPQLVVKEIF